jgi:formylmethanofuran dehydrogenase subunit D
LNKYSAEVVEICENGDAIIQFSDEMMEELGWKANDTLTIKEIKGQIIIENITKHPKLFKD